MNRLNLFTYLTLSVFMSNTLTIIAIAEKVVDIHLIHDFLLKYKSDEFKEYAKLIKKQNNINAKISQYNHRSALHKGICLITFNYIFIRSFVQTASEKGHKDIVEYLLSKGAKVNIEDNSGRSPLHLGE
jgi:hypothetical protein